MACVSHKFFPERPWECKQLRDAGGHPEYIIRFQQTADDYTLFFYIRTFFIRTLRLRLTQILRTY